MATDDLREDFRFLREVALPKLGANYYRHTEQAAREALDRIEKMIDTLIEERDAARCAHKEHH